MLGLVRKDSTSLGFIRGGGMTRSAEREEMAIAVCSSWGFARLRFLKENKI